MSTHQNAAATPLIALKPSPQAQHPASLQTNTSHTIAPPQRKPVPNVQVQNRAALHSARLSPPIGQFFVNLLVQCAGFAAAIAFGIYAVKSVQVGSNANEVALAANKIAEEANRIARDANQLAVIDLCLSNENQV